MTSKNATECFVYLTLPGRTDSVTAGKFVWDNRSTPATGKFVYGKRYLSRADAVALDPIELALTDRTYETARLNGLFGAIRDASPDFWGRRLIERQLGHVPTEMDYMLQSPDDRAGALSFGLNVEPPAPKRDFNKTIALSALQQTASQLLNSDADKSNPDQLRIAELLQLGTSLGGARPKSVVEDDEGLWIAKFNRPDDSWNNPRIEFAMLELAKKCGLSVAQARLATVGEKDILLVKRFDRERTESGYLRARMISGLTVLKSDEGVTPPINWSYPALVEEIRRIVREPSKDAHELFKRICFNALISNLDDHPRNHALIAKNEHWQLSPAYDLTPSRALSLERRDLAMEIGRFGRFANRGNLLSECSRFLLTLEEAEHIIDTMVKEIRNGWYPMLKSCGVSETDAAVFKDAFAYDGFFYSIS